MKKLIIAAALLAACSSDSLSVKLSETTVVELDVFSGRPNPRWQLTPSESAQLEDRLSGLPQTAHAAIPDNLGYRGFYILDQNSERITATSNGYVVIHNSAGDKFYRDTKGVQSWLKQQAEAKGYGELVNR